MKYSNWTCPWCNKEIVSCKPAQKSAHLRNCLDFQLYKSIHLSNESLYQEYVIEKMSLPDIAKKHNVGVSVVYKQIKKFNISTRSVKQSCADGKRQEKIKNTNIKRYGHEHNFCKEHPGRKQWENRLLKEEGIVNVFQRKEIIEKIKLKKIENGMMVADDKLPSFTLYKRLVKTASNKTYRECKKIINPENLIRGRNQYQLDHRCSVLEGFLNHIPVFIISDVVNLQMLSEYANGSKNSKSDISPKELVTHFYGE